MLGKVTKGDIKILSNIAEFGILTVKQLSALTQRNRQSIGRRRRYLENEGYITRYQRGGQQENLIYLTETGIKFLQKEGLLTDNVNKVTKKEVISMFIEHTLLTNWVLIHLLQIGKAVPRLKTKYTRIESDKITQGNAKKAILFPKFKIDSDNIEALIPDSIFSITDRESKKSFLFFIEVDMGTEALKSKTPKITNIQRKIVKYQIIFRDKLYKRCEQFFDTKFNGFRLLFLSNTTVRLAALCRHVQEMPPTDFVWLTDQKKMFTRGLSSKIWFRGGRDNDAKQSILGRLSCEAPVHK